MHECFFLEAWYSYRAQRPSVTTSAYPCTSTGHWHWLVNRRKRRAGGGGLEGQEMLAWEMKAGSREPLWEGRGEWVVSDMGYFNRNCAIQGVDKAWPTRAWPHFEALVKIDRNRNLCEMSILISAFIQKGAVCLGVWLYIFIKDIYFWDLQKISHL